MKEKVSLVKLFTVFAKIGVMTFGGGLAMLPMLTREVVEKNNWCTEEELSDYYAIGQCTPGIIAINTATFVGYKERGVFGGIFATLGMVFPSLIIIMGLAGILSAFSDNIYVQKAFEGIRVCVCILVINTVIKLWKSAIRGKATLILFLVAVTLTIIFRLSPVIVTIVAAVIGIINARLSLILPEDKNA